MNERLNLLAKEITSKTNQVINKNTNINNQMASNEVGFKNNMSELNHIASNIQNQDAHMDDISGIVRDSDIVVLQENYRYLLWSILAIAVVSVSLSVLKNR